tara:strand:+ start:1126 stop:2817 length:1692 start_codon:yes stop_codon:yes gene_type:complete
MAQKTYEEERKHLEQCVPKLFKGSGVPNKSYREIVIKFEGANLQNYANLAKALEIYCWPSNTKKTGSVTDPFVDGGPERGKVEGLWRFTSVDPTHSRTEGLFLTLREGYASAIQWDEARVPSRDILPQTDNVPIEAGVSNTEEDYIDIIFPNVDPEKSADMAEAFLALATVTAPTIWTHVYSGIYHILRSRVREEQDGSHSIVGVLARPRSFVKTYDNYNSHNAADVYYLHHVPKLIVQSILDNGAYKTDGASATLNYSTERGTYDIVIRTGVDDPITIINKKTQDGCLTEIYSDFYYGITKTALDAISIGNAPQGWIYDIVGISPAANGRFNVRVDRVEAQPKTAPEYTSNMTSSRVTLTQEKKNQELTQDVGVAEQGIIKKIRSIINRFCVYDSVEDSTTSTPWEVNFTIAGVDGNEIHTVKGNQREILYDPPASGSVHSLTGWSRNEDGTYNWHLVETVDQFASETTSYWFFKTTKDQVVILRKPINGKQYQAQIRVYLWKYESKYFKTEDAAYLWLRENDNLWASSGVNVRGKTRFTAHRIKLETDFGWQNDGGPFSGE